MSSIGGVVAGRLDSRACLGETLNECLIPNIKVENNTVTFSGKLIDPDVLETFCAALKQELFRCENLHVNRPMDLTDSQRCTGMRARLENLDRFFVALKNSCTPTNTYPSIAPGSDLPGLVSQLYRHYRTGSNKIGESWNQQFLDRIDAVFSLSKEEFVLAVKRGFNL